MIFYYLFLASGSPRGIFDAPLCGVKKKVVLGDSRGSRAVSTVRGGYRECNVSGIVILWFLPAQVLLGVRIVHHFVTKESVHVLGKLEVNLLLVSIPYDALMYEMTFVLILFYVSGIIIYLFERLFLILEKIVI